VRIVGIHMKIIRLMIENFRGIKKADIIFPDSRIVCLIGAGDSTKSTILDAINMSLYPSWNLPITDNDFYNGDINYPIKITGSFGEIPDVLMAENKYGFFLRNAMADLDDKSNDEPTDLNNVAISIQLFIDDSLRPIWSVVSNQGTKEISDHDRALLIHGLIGTKPENNLVWGKYSVLQKYLNSKDYLKDTYTNTIRNIIKDTNLESLDVISDKIGELGKQYGVSFTNDINNKILMQTGSLSSIVGLFDGNVPVCQRGLGSQRLLSIALSIDSSEGSSLILIDEIENGLEPYRLSNLIRELQKSHNNNGQVIFTTHSTIPLEVCGIDNLLTIHNFDGITYAQTLKTDNPKTNNDIQAELRRNPSAFLCKKIIVCEGKTEFGLIQSFDAWIEQTKSFRIAYYGAAAANGGGDSLVRCAHILKSCGYDVCVFMDSDIDITNNVKIKKESLNAEGIPVFDWELGNSVENQVFNDIDDCMLTDLVNVAVIHRGIDKIMLSLDSCGINYTTHKRDDDSLEIINLPKLTDDIRKSLGDVSNKNKWYKDITAGMMLGDVIFNKISFIDKNCQLFKTFMNILNWTIDNNKESMDQTIMHISNIKGADDGTE